MLFGKNAKKSTKPLIIVSIQWLESIQKTIPKEITDSNGNIFDFSNHLFTGLIDRQNCFNDKFYSFKKNAFTEEKVCWNVKGYVCEVPKFMADIQIYWRLRLDAIIELRTDVNKEDYYCLILFNNNSNPVFCVIDSKLSFTERVRLELNNY